MLVATVLAQVASSLGPAVCLPLVSDDGIELRQGNREHTLGHQIVGWSQLLRLAEREFGLNQFSRLQEGLTGRTKVVGLAERVASSTSSLEGVSDESCCTVRIAQREEDRCALGINAVDEFRIIARHRERAVHKRYCLSRHSLVAQADALDLQTVNDTRTVLLIDLPPRRSLFGKFDGALGTNVLRQVHGGVSPKR